MTQRYRSLFGLSDGVLLALALVGFVVFAVALPAQHPFSALDYGGRAEARAAAEQFLTKAGFVPPADQKPDVHLRGNGPLLDTLQRTLGRPQAIALIQSAEGQALGAFHWRVWWRNPDRPEEELAIVRLTPDGRVLSFDVRQTSQFEQVEPSTGELEGLPGPVDTLLVPPVAEAMEARARVRQFRLGPERVQALLAQTAYAGLGLRVDSVSDGATFRAFLSGATVAGRPLQVEMHLNRMVQLVRLDADVVGGADDEVVTPRDLYGLGIIALYVLLLVIVFVVFFRRLSQRLVDTRAALRDALWVALAGVGWMASTSIAPVLKQVPSLWIGLGIVVFTLLLGGLGTAFVGFAASGAGDSFTRPVWPQRLASLSLLRMGAWYDARVGAALVRGLAGAGVMLGLLTLAFLLLPRAVVHLGGESVTMAEEVALSPALFFASFYSLLNLFLLYGIVLVVGAGLWRRLGAFAYVVMAVLLAATQLVVLSDVPAWQFAFHLAPVLIALWLFHRHDALTAFVSLAAYGMLWDLAYVWMGRDVPGLTGGLILIGVLALLFAIGLGVMLRGWHVREDRVLVPSYIRERQHEARMERELEIAHNVQLTFLPRQMPDVAGLDVAALCLPAMEVGGDYYDFVELGDGRLGLVIGDVSGKGIQAAFYMTLVKGFVRSLARTSDGPADVLRRINRLFCESAPRGTFISMIYGVVDTQARTFTFARAGHNPVILHRAPSQQADMVQPPGMAIGLDAGPRFDASLREETMDLGVGDTLVLYTDGFSEAMNHDRALYGDERLAHRASAAQSTSARHLLDTLTHAVNAFMDGEAQHDDMTMIVVRCTFTGV